jgi:hypothetical protein
MQPPEKVAMKKYRRPFSFNTNLPINDGREGIADFDNHATNSSTVRDMLRLSSSISHKSTRHDASSAMGGSSDLRPLSQVKIYGVPVYSKTLDRALQTSHDDFGSRTHRDYRKNSNDSMESVSLHDNMDETKMIEVEWNGDDEEDKRNMGQFRRWLITLILAIGSFQV